MRQNLPVTQKGFDYDPRATLMSTTTLDSRITYANAAFIAVSGFDHDEIVGEPHNMVRHPDMPREAFADMWATLKAGRSWTALVKNRRKNGDHYWVRANATPMVRNGTVTGYMSVRTKPAAAEVEAAEALYRRFREGRAGGLRFHQGLVVRSGWRAWQSVFQRLSVGGRLGLGLLLPMAASLGVLSLVAPSPMVWLAGAAAVLGGGALASWFLHRQIIRPLQQIAAQAQNVASGNRTENVNLDRVDDIGMIMRSVNQAGLNLRSLVDDVNVQVSGLGVVGEQIAQGNGDLSARTEQSASSLQQTAASMEQLTATVKQNASTSGEATRLARVASDAATEGGKVVGGVVTTMAGITQSSRKIADIIGVIDGIAFQTNILALNAAVEAARAGEQGRGFAVVAGEVRSLAQRSAEAAKEIKALIGVSVERVEAGSTQAEMAGQRMRDIVERVQRVSALISEITTASSEQAEGLSQIGQAVSMLDESTQQNTALVEQSAAAAESLRMQTLRLMEALAVYQSAESSAMRVKPHSSERLLLG